MLLPQGRLARLCALLIGLVQLPGLMHAQAAPVTPEDDYKKLLRVSEDIQPLGDHPFGEQISLYNGSLSFEQVDVDLPGTGLPLQVVRSFHLPDLTADSYFQAINSPFADWDIVVPHIETLTAEQVGTDGSGNPIDHWFFLEDQNRCSQLRQAPAMVVSNRPGDEPTLYEPDDWWQGYELVVPGEGRQDLLVQSMGATPLPDMKWSDGSAISFPIVTKNLWAVACLPNMHDGSAGQGFLAISPQGIKYSFDWLVSHQTTSTDKGAGRALSRRVASMLVSKIEDRFGNWLKYQYDADGNPTQITASDGRKVTFAYETWQEPDQDPWGNYSNPPSHRIKSITAVTTDGTPSRTWSYAYTADGNLFRLSAVTLPDDSAWSFNLGGLRPPSLDRVIDPPQACAYTLHPDAGTSSTGTITAPSGLKGTFTVKTTIRGRSYVRAYCEVSPETGHEQWTIPDVYATAAITSESIGGAGLPSSGREWQYGYSSPNASYASNCASGCTSSVQTVVTNPDGKATRYTFSNTDDASETQLVKTEYFNGAVGTSLARVESNGYAPPSSGPWPSWIGHPQQGKVNADQIGRISPLNQHVISQEQDTYTWQAEAFNNYAQATKTKRCNSFSRLCDSSSVLPPVEEQTDYLNDPAYWVLGLPTQVSNLTMGDVVDHYDYHADDTLAARSHFGQPLMSYTFDPYGQLASFTDGNNHTTTLGSYVDENGAVVTPGYKRGIPLAVGYPDRTYQRLEVSDFGQIKSITDQDKATTGYTYDEAGRLHEIDYPTSDGQARFKETITFTPVGSDERGISGPHWRRTVVRGARYQRTYYNALLQPILTDTFIYNRPDSVTSMRTDYDYRGLTTLQSYPKGGTPDLAGLGTGTHNTYDAIGRLTDTWQDSELGSLLTHIDYLEGAAKRVTDPKTYATTTTYQAFDTPTYDAAIKVVAPDGTLTQTIARDGYGNPRSITQSGLYNSQSVSLTKTLSYDAYYRLCRITEPESGSEAMGYDGANNLLWSAAGLTLPAPTTDTPADCQTALVADEAKTIRTYDAMNRVESVTYPAGTDGAIYTYTPTGAIKTASSSSGLTKWTYDYNAVGQLNTETLDVEGYHWPISYTHDAYGNTTMVTYPDGKQVSYAPDALGRSTKVGAYATDISYYPDGSVENYRVGNGTEYLADQKPQRPILDALYYFHGGADNPVVQQQYTYDPNGNLIAVDDQVDHRRDKIYGYDELNRLTSAQANGLWGMETYRYDPLNNLREVDSDSLARIYTYSANQLAAISDGVGGPALHNYRYDPQGNVIQKDSTSLVFDKANRLTQAVGGSQYAYDVSGRRVKKTAASGNATYYAYTSDGRLLYQFDAAAGLTTDYVYLGRQLTAEVRRNTGDLVLNPPAAIYFDVAPNDGNYTVGWYTVGTASYNLQESSDGGASWHDVYSGTENSKSFSGKAPGGYLYQVRACEGECSDWRGSTTLGVWPTLATVTVPSGLQSADFTVSWSRPASATGFDVDEQKDGGNWVRIATDTPDTSITRAGLAAGSYVYRVAAKNAYGNRGWAISDPVTVLYAPSSAPMLHAPSVSSTPSFTVSWSAVATADRYKLEVEQNGVWGSQYDGANLSTVISGVTNGAQYDYRIRACNAIDCGPVSAVATVQIAIPPPAPTDVYDDFRIVNSKVQTLTVVWSASSGATYYKVKNLHTNEQWSTTNTAYVAESGMPIIGDDYAVTACNQYACSAWVNGIYRDLVTLPSTAPTLTAPTGSTGSYTVSWGEVSQASTYSLQESANGGTWTPIQNTSATSHAFSKGSGTYAYKVAGCNTHGCGPWSATKTVTVTAPPPAPTGAKVVEYFFGKVDGYRAQWNAVSGATSYEAKRNDTGASVYSGTATSFIMDTATVPDMPRYYQFSVRACKASVCSSWVVGQ